LTECFTGNKYVFDLDLSLNFFDDSEERCQRPPKKYLDSLTMCPRVSRIFLTKNIALFVVIYSLDDEKLFINKMRFLLNSNFWDSVVMHFEKYFS